MMMKLFFTGICALLLIIGASGQYCTGDARFSETTVFSNAQISSDTGIVYANVVNWQGNNQTLKLNVHYPNLSMDTLAQRPFILMIHGGGFISGKRQDLDGTCREFAKRGFVAATISYRLGLNCISDLLSYDKAVYRAIQDAQAALRFTVENAGLLRIDTSWMFIGGSSAGAVTALGVAYISQSEWNSSQPSLVSTLGTLHNSGNSLTHTYSLKGIFNNWGATPKAFIETDELLPMVSFHGEADNVVAVDSFYAGSCINPPLTYGSRMIHHVLTNAGICSDLTVKPNGGHGIYTGSTANNAFRVGRASCFFKSLFCNQCVSFYTTDSIPANCAAMYTATENINGPGNAVHIFPNPVQSSIFIQGMETGSAFEIIIYNSLGQLCYQAYNETIVPVASWMPGMYFCQLRKNGTVYTYTFLKE